MFENIVRNILVFVAFAVMMAAAFPAMSQTAEPDLPVLPQAPVLTDDGYPACREDYQKIAAPFDKAKAINKCTAKLDKYYAEVLTPFRKQMIAHQNDLSQIYTDKVAGKMEYQAKTRDDFYRTMMAEHAASDPGGDNLAEHSRLEARYQEDRAYLQDRFCFNTGCGGYPMPAQYVEEEKKSDKKRSKSARKSDRDKCKTTRQGGGLLGGILGGVVGDAAGLGTVGKLLASGVGAVLVGEIACQLDEKEQVVAAEATVEVTEKEEVGATATWQSPTRSGVSGSSTVTALNTQPNGTRCLSVTDIAIIDGEETRVSKQMCRGNGEQRYTVMA